MYKIPFEEWTKRAEQHSALIDPLADAFLKRRQTGIKHPVYDFLFTYYSFSPAKLKNWVPSFQETLLGFTDSHYLQFPWFNNDWFSHQDHSIFINPLKITPYLLENCHFILKLSQNVLNKPARFGCFGLHEWAMVYKMSKEALRHQTVGLRLPISEINHIVESQSLCCTHYDAFRFFTKEATPKNAFKPTLALRQDMEQGGCIHANMDLYKWSAKLWPWLGSDLIAKTFLLSVEGRILDMQASPYDLQEQGFAPICIETEEGRKLYQVKQQAYATKASILRQELVENVTLLLSHIS